MLFGLSLTSIARYLLQFIRPTRRQHPPFLLHEHKRQPLKSADARASIRKEQGRASVDPRDVRTRERQRVPHRLEEPDILTDHQAIMRQEECGGLPSVDRKDIRVSAFGMGEMSRVNSGVDGFKEAINNPEGRRRDPGHTPNSRSCGLYSPATHCVQENSDASTARSQGAVPPRADDPKARSRGGVPPRADISKALSQGDFHQATMLRWPSVIVSHCI